MQQRLKGGGGGARRQNKETQNGKEGNKRKRSRCLHLATLQHLSPAHTGKIWSGTYFWSSECTAKYWRNCELHPGMGKRNNICICFILFISQWLVFCLQS